MTANDWATIASLATALGTLVLAVATFSAVRSGNRTARAAERSLQTSLRPLLLPSRREDALLKVNFGDDKWVHVPGGSGIGEIGGGDGTLGPPDAVIYLALSVRNVGTGLAVLHGWRFHTERPRATDAPPPLDEFRMQTRDMYIPPGDIGFWQGAVRDLADPQYDEARKAIEGPGDWMVDLLYGDQEGGQRVISRFRMQPRMQPRRAQAAAPGSSDDPVPGSSPDADPRRWAATIARHWNIDRPDPRLNDRPAAG